MRCELILTGAELLDGRWRDTNTQLLAQALRPLGLTIDRATVVGDAQDDIAAVLAEAVGRADVVICTGGLGPTIDDRTREAAAAVFGLPLIEDSEMVTHLEKLFEAFGRTMSPNNRRQAQFPEGAIVLPNPMGTAAGFAVAHEGHWALFAPGVPRELELMATAEIAPFLRARLALSDTVVSVSLRTFGFSESGLDRRLTALDLGEVELAFTAVLPEIMVTLTARDTDAERAKARVDKARRAVAGVVGLAEISADGRTLEEVVAGLLTARGLTLATAESCTGGLVAGRCTNVPGSSKWFLEGAVTYSNDAKIRRLGVPGEIIAAHGAVSQEVAEAMANGQRAATGADLAIAITGIAGPDGGSAAKPVGLVHMALASAAGVAHWRDVFAGDRIRVRAMATEHALDRLRRYLLS